MKRLISAIVLLILSVSVSAWSAYTYKKHMIHYSHAISNLLAVCETEQKSDAVKEAETIVEQWHETDDLLHSLVVHEGMDELEEIITALPEIAKHSDIEELKINCIEAIEIIDNLLESEQISIGNVL